MARAISPKNSVSKPIQRRWPASGCGSPIAGPMEWGARLVGAARGWRIDAVTLPCRRVAFGQTSCLAGKTIVFAWLWWLWAIFPPPIHLFPRPAPSLPAPHPLLAYCRWWSLSCYHHEHHHDNYVTFTHWTWKASTSQNREIECSPRKTRKCKWRTDATINRQTHKIFVCVCVCVGDSDGKWKGIFYCNQMAILSKLEEEEDEEERKKNVDKRWPITRAKGWG